MAPLEQRTLACLLPFQGHKLLLLEPVLPLRVPPLTLWTYPLRLTVRHVENASDAVPRSTSSGLAPFLTHALPASRLHDLPVLKDQSHLLPRLVPSLQSTGQK